jgi:hypothetical protein
MAEATAPATRAKRPHLLYKKAHASKFEAWAFYFKPANASLALRCHLPQSKPTNQQQAPSTKTKIASSRVITKLLRLAAQTNAAFVPQFSLRPGT